jgi:hypothetical protein
MEPPYLAMALATLTAVPAALLLRRSRRWSLVVGAGAWIALIAHVPVEFAVIEATTTPYDPLRHVVSALGVTSCAPDPMPGLGAAVCSPQHLLMNWTFTLGGIALAVGAICLRDAWPADRRYTVATWLLAAVGISYATSGVIPADVDLAAHTILAVPGMIAQVPAWIIIATGIGRTRPLVAAGTWIAAAAHIGVLVTIPAAVAWDWPGGLLQRVMYWAPFVWAPVVAIALVRGARQRSSRRAIRSRSMP